MLDLILTLILIAICLCASAVIVTALKLPLFAAVIGIAVIAIIYIVCRFILYLTAIRQEHELRLTEFGIIPEGFVRIDSIPTQQYLRRTDPAHGSRQSVCLERRQSDAR